MFVEETTLFGRPLAPHLRQGLDSQEAAIMRVTDPGLLAPGLAQERIKPSALPELLREEAEFDTRENGDEVAVRLKVPVTGNIKLLELVPEGHEYARIRAKITDDLARGADQQGNSYTSDAFEEPSSNRRSGFVLSRNFPSSATADEIRGWARELLDQIESYLPAMRDQIAAHEDHAQAALADRAEARRQALTRASGLKCELGRGVEKIRGASQIGARHTICGVGVVEHGGASEQGRKVVDSHGATMSNSRTEPMVSPDAP